MVSSDIKDFRKFRTSLGGSATRQPTANPDYYQIREMGVYGSAIIILVLWLMTPIMRLDYTKVGTPREQSF